MAMRDAQGVSVAATLKRHRGVLCRVAANVTLICI